MTDRRVDEQANPDGPPHGVTTTQPSSSEHQVGPPPHDTTSEPAPGRSFTSFLEGARYLVAIGAITSLALSATGFLWAVAKAGKFVVALVGGTTSEDLALVKLFESIDTILIGTVMLIIGLGLWELFIEDLALPPALTTTSFDDLKAKVATTLLLVLVVRFLEVLVSRPDDRELLELGIAVTLVGGLLLALAGWRKH